jgi:hypothetical protein
MTMPSDRTIWRRSFVRAITGCCVVLGLGCVLSSFASHGMAQTSGTTQAPIATRSISQPAVAVPASLQALEQAARNQDFTAVQIRRFRDDKGNVAAVRERLEVDANGSSTPTHAVTFLGVEGVLPGSPVHVKWQNTYSRFGPLFYSHGSFRVRELSAALGNYVLHDFGSVVRAGRSARRAVIFPNSVDKAIWVVDVDVATSVPLYTAEYDVQMRVHAEVEVVAFATTVGVLPGTPAWITHHQDYLTARTFLGQPAGLIDPDTAVTSEYTLHRVEVRDDPLTAQRSLVMTYTDGVDQFMVTQIPNAIDPFQDLPMKGTGQVISRYRDAAMSALIYYEGGVLFQVQGRGALHRLDPLARRLYLQALASN